MHECLRLSGACVEYTPCLPQYLKNQRIIRSFLVPPTHEPRVTPNILHANVLFHTDGESMQCPFRLPILQQVLVKIIGALQSTLGEKLSDAIRLPISALHA